MFWRQRDLFAIAVAIAWLSTSLFDVAVYAGDARTLVLPLVTPGGGDPIHDWNSMLGRLALLSWDKGIALALRAAGTALMAAAIALGGWVLWLMLDEGRRAPLEGVEMSSIE